MNEDVIQAEGELHRRLRSQAWPIHTCAGCGGVTLRIRDGLCRVCFDGAKRSSDLHDRKAS